MPEDAQDYTATSFDDPWLDDLTFWSLAERNTVFDIIHAINTTHLTQGQSYLLQMQAASEDGQDPASIILTAREQSGPHPFRLQHMADCFCRLIRPARYILDDMEDPDREIWNQVFCVERVSAHKRLSTFDKIPEMAAAIGRTDFGITAALDELFGWPADRPARAAH